MLFKYDKILLTPMITILCSSFVLGQNVVTSNPIRTADFINGETGWIAGNDLFIDAKTI